MSGAILYRLRLTVLKFQITMQRWPPWPPPWTCRMLRAERYWLTMLPPFSHKRPT